MLTLFYFKIILYIKVGDIYMSIGANIKCLREARNITQKELGEAVGVSDKAVSTWELGVKEPRMGTIQKLADFFGVSKSDIIEDLQKTPAEADVTFDDFTYAMYGEAKELTDEDKNMLLEMARMFKKRQQEGK